MRAQQQGQQGQGPQYAPAQGGTMQMQPAQMPAMGGQGQSGMGAAMGAMPSATSMADMLRRMQGGGGQFAMSPAGEKVPVVDQINPVLGRGY